MKLGDSLGRRRRRRKDRAPSGRDEWSDEATSGQAEPKAGLLGAALRARDFLVGVILLIGAALRGRNFLVWVVPLILLGWVIGYGLATRVVFPAPPPPGDLFEVPDLRGLGLASANERLAGAGLQVASVDSLQHPTVAAGLVLGQSPLPGQVSQPRTPVRVTISTGPQMRSVPDVVSLAEDRARIVLETSGFVVSVDTMEAEEPRGHVVEMSPPPGGGVALPAEILLTISAGPPVVPMPLVLGLEQIEAEAMLDSLGLVVTDVEEVFRFGRDQGIVVEQDPAADTELERGSRVRLKVGRRGGGGEQ